MRCQEKQKQKLVDMIKCALNEIGCEELPSGCDEHLEQNFIENSFNNDQQVIALVIYLLQFILQTYTHRNQVKGLRISFI